MPRLFKLVWIYGGASLLASAGLLCTGSAALAQDCDSCGSCRGCKKEPIVTWYAPAPPYPNYFGPPYPYTSYLQTHWITPPAESALMVKQRLVFVNAELMSIPPLPPNPPGWLQDPTHGNAPSTHGIAPGPAPQPVVTPEPTPPGQPATLPQPKDKPLPPQGNLPHQGNLPPK